MQIRGGHDGKDLYLRYRPRFLPVFAAANGAQRFPRSFVEVLFLIYDFLLEMEMGMKLRRLV